MSANTITLMPLHASQREVYKSLGKRTILRCGRRWGKTALIEVVSEWDALQGRRTGIFAPDYSRLTELYGNLVRTLKPAIRTSNKQTMEIELVTGGKIDVWTCNDPNAGRSRKYHRAILDEAGFIPDLENLWNNSIKPTLVDYSGSAMVCGTPMGIAEENYFYKLSQNKIASPEWPVVWDEVHKTIYDNPTLPAEELATLKRDTPPLPYEQEFMAEWVSWAGKSIFQLPSLLVDGKGVAYPQHCECVFATVDTAVKDGAENDGTGVIFWAINKHMPDSPPLTILDWDLLQINSNLQVGWLPSVFDRLEQLAVQTKARFGSLGCWIEDKQSGSMLLQDGADKGWPVAPIDARLTALGKSGRAQLSMGPVFQGRVKLSQHAFDKVTDFKGTVKNHLISQVCGFVLADKQAYKRADDLADCAFYGILVCFQGEQPHRIF